MSEYITTYTGIHFYPASPRMEDLCIADIAHALSMICRGNGQVKIFYSVGEHCINCAEEALARGYGSRVALACLLHDASESYMSDVPSPFKKYIRDYITLEDHLLELIYQKYLGSELREEERSLLKKIDKELLAYDLYYLLGEGRKEDLVPLMKPYKYGRNSFQQVEEQYLQLFRKLSLAIER